MESEKSKNQSTEALDDQSTDSVYDFLYHDAPRVASFLSQFDNAGHLTQVVQGEGATRSKTDTGAGAVEGGIPLVAKGNLSYSNNATDGYRNDSQRTYDPVWANALALLDYLSAREMIVRDISTARIGQFAMVSGALQINDLRMVHKMLNLPTVRKSMGQSSAAPTGNRKDRRSSSRHQGATNSPTDMELGFDLLGVMPQSVQASIGSGDSSTWCTLKDDCLTIQPGELFLKHGLSIPGVWNAIGIVDAVPDTVGDAAVDSDALALGILQTGLGAIVSALVPVTRTFLGRPQHSFGITPLLIFREAEPS